VNLSLTLPLPPSVNAMYRVVGRRSILSKDARDWYASAVPKIAVQADGMVFDGNVAVDYTFYFPNNIRRDCFNYEKALSDAITKAGVWGDDCQITDGSVHKRISKECPRVEVLIRCV